MYIRKGFIKDQGVLDCILMLLCIASGRAMKEPVEMLLTVLHVC